MRGMARRVWLAGWASHRLELTATSPLIDLCGRQLSFARLGAVIAAKERRESIEPKQGLEEAGDSKLEAARATAG